MSEQKNGVIRKYYNYKEIKLWREYFEFNGKIEGEYKEYYDNGQLSLIFNYKNQKTEGKYTLYYSNGQLKKICNYKNNIKIRYK